MVAGPGGEQESTVNGHKRSRQGTKTARNQFTEVAVPLGEVTQNQCIAHERREHFLMSKISLDEAIRKGKERKTWPKTKELNGGDGTESNHGSSPLSRPTPGRPGASIKTPVGLGHLPTPE